MYRITAFCLAVCLAIGLSVAGFAANAAQDENRPSFGDWLETFRGRALEAGIRTETLDSVLPGITPVERVIKRDRSQPEVVQTYASYLKARVSDWRVTKGRERYRDDADLLTAVSSAHGVQNRFIAAIWGIETNYGTVPLSYSVFDAVATLAYDPRRSKRFERELIAALQIIDAGYASMDQMKGSWAGAMGQPQFMPGSYQRYAVDFDGDGRKNIWTSKADVFASIANYLRAHDWRDDQTWGRAVSLPPGGESSLAATQEDGLTPARQCRAYKSLGVWRDLQDWQALGIRRLDGSDLPPRSIPAALVMADAGDDRAYIVYQNFCAIMRYNPSFKYALAVGLLSDEVRR